MLKGPPTSSLKPSIIDLCHALGARYNLFEDHDWEIASEIYHGHSDALRQMDDEHRLLMLQEIRLTSGWWGDNPKTAFADKGGHVMDHRRLKKVLVAKTKSHFSIEDNAHDIQQKLMGPGLLFLQHRSVPCYRYCWKTYSVFEDVQSLLLGAFGGTLDFQPILTLLLCTKVSDWEFYFKYCHQDRIDVLLNDSLFETDSLWPKGSNDRLILTLQTLPELRASMKKHSWPKLFHPVERHEKTNKIECLLPAPKSFRDMTYVEFCRCVIKGDARDVAKYDNTIRQFHSLTLNLKSHSDGKFQDDDVDNAQKICDFMSSLVTSKDREEARVFNQDLLFNSGWWGYSHETMEGDTLVNLDAFIETLVDKTGSWYSTQGYTVNLDKVRKSLGEAGVFVLQHQTIPYFRYVKSSDSVIAETRMLIHNAFKGHVVDDPVVPAMLLCTTADEWKFYLLVDTTKISDALPSGLEELENTTVVMTDSLWPNGANRTLTLNHTTLSNFRDTCMDNRWPKHEEE